MGGRVIDLDGIELIVGPAVVTVPTRVRWSSSETVSSVLRRLQSEAADVILHQHFGLQNIDRVTGSKACAFDVLLVVQGVVSPALESHEQFPAPSAKRHAHVGGDFISALRLAFAARVTEYKLPVALIFKHAVLKDMARIVKQPASSNRLKEDQEAVETVEAVGFTPTTSQTYLRDGPFDSIFPTTEFQSWCVSCGLVKPVSRILSWI
ncbi:hypothetical protein LZ32DRAFT_623397 [Colletotrichum eremochloae]|nr:hypothetical protein LZ32DRAFT_623397 [Colletotrichum eremochloae]